MEDCLSQIVTAAASSNLLIIKKSAQDALGLIRDPAHELREKCLKVVQLCLETKRSKFASLSISCCHRLLRDDRFHSNFEPQDDSKWLLGQLLQATSTFSQQTDDTQVDILKIFLNVACGNVWNMNGRLIINVLSLCSEAFDSGNAAVRTGAQAASCQTLRSFVGQLEEERPPEDTDASTFNEILPIMQYICSSIDTSESSGRCEHGVLFLLECLLTLTSTLPQSVNLNKHLQMFVWQKLAPVLISVLGTPKVDKNIVSRRVSDSEWGRGSGYLAAAPSFTVLHARAVYSISAELVRLLGPILSLRPVLESLFHRILLYPAPAYRLDALRATAELLRNPLRLLDIAGPLNTDEQPCDMALIRLMMDSIEECRKGDVTIMAEAVNCACALLKALEELCRGSCLPSKAVDKMLQLWPALLTCEYSGPAYYQSIARLPVAYQNQIQMEQEAVKNQSDDESDSSGIGQKSDCSGDTEGPESVEKELDDDPIERDLNLDRLEKVPRTLCLEIVDIPISLGDSERQHARHFIGALHDLLATLKPLWCSTQLDRAIQTFASQYCQGVVRDQPITQWGIIVNADGIYLTTLQALLLDLGLYKAGYYGAPEQTPHLTEDEFVQRVQTAGILVYLSGSWLREVYQAVVSGSLLQAHGYLPTNTQTHSLINLLTDIGGLGSRQRGSEMLWECRRVECSNQSADPPAEVAAGLRLARLLLTCCWTSLLRILAVPLSAKAVRGKRRQAALRDAVTCSLDSLQAAARLCSLLGVQDRCDLILELLCNGVCSSWSTLPKSLLSTRDSPPRLTVPISLSLELILQEGLELGSHCLDCWPHVFRSVLFVRRIERAVFNAAGGRDVSVTPPGFQGQEAASGGDDDVVDVYSFLRSSSSELMVSRYIKSAGCVDSLTAPQTASVVTLLSYMSAELTTDAAYKLNLEAFEAFARALCAASRNQLFPPFKQKQTGLPSAPSWIQKWLPPQTSPHIDTYLLDLVGELMVKCARSCRPLAHVMRLWSVIGPHLTEAACHADLVVSKKAVELIEAVISSHMKQESELSYFHFNEALFKPFENLLCLELCDGDVQDQVVASICEFVEGSAGDVRSGWRALFGALRAVPTTAAVASATFLDVFALFLDTKSPLIFCSAAVDCILCLLKHIRSSCPLRRAACVQFLQRCEDVLAAIFVMPQAVVFQAAHRIHVSDGLLVEPEPASPRLVQFQNIPSDLQNLPSFSYTELSLRKDEKQLCLDTIDRPSGVLRVWFLLLEGLYSAAIAADSTAQPSLLEATFTDIMNLIERPDPRFGVLCINRMLLPATQSWLRQMWRESVTDLSGPKQALGLLSDLTVTCFKNLHGNVSLEPELSLMLKQLLLLLVECAPQPSTASTPTSCFRHIIINVGQLFTREQWQIAVLSLRRAFELTLIPLRQILMAFSAGSHSFYGDYDQVKVAARRDGTSYDVLHLKHLSQQVFLLEGQREQLSPDGKDTQGERIYAFLLNPSNDPNSTDVQRIPVRLLVFSLLTHQGLLQIVAGLLLEGSSHVIPSLTNIILKADSSRSCDSKLPGVLCYMSKDDVLLLLNCLDLSYQSALQFDARPGLKFLVQKVAGLERAANLYGQAGAAWAVKVVVLFELCLHHCKQENISADHVKEILIDTSVDTDAKTFMCRLRQNFEDLCDTYIDMVLDNDGAHSAIDKATDQSILFLNTCQDEPISHVMPRKSESEANPLDTKEVEERPVFHFSDFVDTVSVSSTSESELEFAEESEEEAENCSKEIGDDDDDGHSQFDLKPEETSESQSDKNIKCYESKRDVHETSLIVDTVPVELEDRTIEATEPVDGKDENEKANLGMGHVGQTPDSETISVALEEYKRRKKKQSIPRVNPFDQKRIEKPPPPSIPPEIETQRRNSFLKDSEAHRKVWAEMLGTVFNLLSQLTDDEFRTILPLLFNGIRKLTAHVSDTGLKESVSELFHRVSLVYGFAGLST